MINHGCQLSVDISTFVVCDPSSRITVGCDDTPVGAGQFSPQSIGYFQAKTIFISSFNAEMFLEKQLIHSWSDHNGNLLTIRFI